MAWREIKLGVWQILYEPDATREFYASVPPSVCNCANCRNFRANWRVMVPEDQMIIKQFGIDPVYHGEIMLPWRQGEHTLMGYIGIHHFIGKVLASPFTDFTGFHYPAQAGVFSVSFEEEVFAQPKNFPEPCVQLMYGVAVPWLLDDELMTV